MVFGSHEMRGIWFSRNEAKNQKRKKLHQNAQDTFGQREEFWRERKTKQKDVQMTKIGQLFLPQATYQNSATP